MTTPRGEFAHDDLTITAVLHNGKRHTFTTCSSITYGNGLSSSTVGGTQPGPKAHGGRKAEPKCEMEISRGEEDELRGKQGDGWIYRTVDLQIVYSLPGRPDIIDRVETWLPLGDETSSQAGDPSMTKLEGNCLKVVKNGIDPFKKPRS
ncbi:hypothetical protein [Polyangium spumosum]|uniref:Uncharacterized protein n=1 Tax=Polyangium spumosum TaxID=889282 RepID=A0A6N7Q3Q6_9BACT|nr:hypothetical protein [Polyangium spumosum]MRG97846.1 hypothetical protein [Polyangium spumosum]MRG98304.1 hypothetical protein [Polyangium spumosum]